MVYRQHRIRNDRLGFNRSQLPDTDAAMVFPPCSKRNRTRDFAAPRPTHWPDWLSPRPPKPAHRRPIPRRQLRPPLRRGNLLEGPVPPWPLVTSLPLPWPEKYAPFAQATRRRSSSPPPTNSAAPQSAASFSNSANPTCPPAHFTNATASSPPAAARLTTMARSKTPCV